MQAGATKGCVAALRCLAAAGVVATLMFGLNPAHAQKASTFWLAGGEAADTKSEDWTAGAHLRSLYLDRGPPSSGSDFAAWTLGGWLYAQSPYFFDVMSFGATGYGSFPLWRGPNPGQTDMLQPDGDSLANLGEAFARLQYAGQGITLYRQLINPRYPVAAGVRGNRLDLAFIGTRDIRSVPLTYEAAMASGTVSDSLRYFAGYVWNVKPIDENGFESMSSLAGASGTDDGMWLGGVQWSPVTDLWLQGWYHNVRNTLAISFVDADYVNRPSKEWYWRVGTQYAYQSSTGTDQLTGSEFSTWNWGAYGEVGWKYLKGYAAYSTTGDGANISTPYSKGPLYITQRIKDFTRAGEQAWLIGGTIDFSSFGLTGLSFDINAAIDSNAGTNPGTGAANPKWTEYDYDLIYRFGKETWFDGMRVRLRYAQWDQDNGATTIRTNDFRVDLNWTYSFK